MSVFPAVRKRKARRILEPRRSTVDDLRDQPAPPPGELRNGFSGLAEFDKAANGGNGDGKITSADYRYCSLRLTAQPAAARRR